jgi:hypothetical protein
MVGTMQKIKNALTPGHHAPGHRHDNYDNTATGTYGTTAGTGYTDTGVNAQSAGIAGQPGYGYAETVVATNAAQGVGMQGAGYGAETAGYAAGTGVGAVVHQGVEAEICNRREYVEVEDRPVLKERVERIVEHQPVEKRFVVETRPVGETVLAERAHVESAGVTERVIDRAEGTVCPTGTVPVATGLGGHHGHHHGVGTGGMGATVVDSHTTTTHDRCADGNCARP